MFNKNKIDWLIAKKLNAVAQFLIGGVEVTATAAEINTLHSSGATNADLVKLHAVTAAATELNVLDGAPMAATITVGAEAVDAINVAIQLKDAAGADLAVRGSLLAYLSDDANGDSVAGTAPDTVAIGTDGLAIPLVAGKTWLLTSEADGDIDLNIGENGADTWYLILCLPNGKLVASAAITFAGP